MKHQSGRITILNPWSPRNYFGVVPEIVDLCRIFDLVKIFGSTLIPISLWFLSRKDSYHVIVLINFWSLRRYRSNPRASKNSILELGLMKSISRSSTKFGLISFDKESGAFFVVFIS